MPSFTRRLPTVCALALVSSLAPGAAADAADCRLSIDDAQYKRIHRKALHAVEQGCAAESARQLAVYAAAHPEDAETRYALAVAHARLGDLDAAWGAVQEAVALGLSPARFVAGPREWFAPLADHPAFQAFLQRHREGLIHGPLVGAITDTSAAVWVRTGRAREVTVRHRVATGAGPWRVTASASTAADTDYTAVVRVEGLSAATRYQYEVLLDGAPVDAAEHRVFQTFPAQGQAAAFRVAFGGCAGFVPWHERAWHSIAAQQPDALIMLGDNVYIDHPESPNIQRYKYYRRQARDEWRALTGRVPVFAIYDDHDFGDNDVWGGPEIETPAWKRPAWALFTHNWANPAYGGGAAQPGCWFQFSIADVDVFMLDGRYYRTNPEDAGEANPSMLGPAQKRWFLDALGRSTATFKVLASPVPWAEGAKPRSRDTWDGYPAERAEIFDFIRERRIEGVILISSDRHRSDLWRSELPGLYPLYEFNSGQLTNQHTHEEMPEAIFSYNRKQSFGLIDFDTTRDDPTVAYTIATIDGEHVHRHEIPLSALRFK